MRIKGFLLAIILFLILLGLKAYAPEVKQATNEELDSLIYETSDIEEVKEIETVEDIGEPEAIFTYNPLSDEVKTRIVGVSYKENDKVKIDYLVYVQITHWGFDDKEHQGEIILNKAVAGQVVEIFKELYDAKFPIEKIRIIDEYDADDELSMLDNNSSAFCYREIAGSKGKLSNHSYGIAIDINPVQNPYVKKSMVLPESGREYLDRTDVRKGMIIKGDPCYNAFIERGWTWGGDWKSLKDYQHFEFKLDK